MPRRGVARARRLRRSVSRLSEPGQRARTVASLLQHLSGVHLGAPARARGGSARIRLVARRCTRRARARPHRRRDTWHPAGVARVAARLVAGRAGARLRIARLDRDGQPHRAGLPPPAPTRAARYAPTAARGGGRTTRRRHAVVARGRLSRDRSSCRRTGRGGRAGFVRRTRDVSSSAGSLRDLPDRGRGRPARGARRAGRGHRSRDRPRPSRLAPCVRGCRSRRRRRAGAGAGGAAPDGEGCARDRRGVPGAGDGVDRRPEPTGDPSAGRDREQDLRR